MDTNLLRFKVCGAHGCLKVCRVHVVLGFRVYRVYGVQGSGLRVGLLTFDPERVFFEPIYG